MQKESHSSHSVGAVKSSKFSRSDKKLFKICLVNFYPPARHDRFVELDFYQVFSQVVLGRVLISSEFLPFLLQIISDLSVAFYIFLQSPAAAHSLP